MLAASQSSKPVTIVLLPGMDGTGMLFANFVAALGDAATTVVVSYPTGCQLDYRELTDLARTHLPQGGDFVLLGESFSGPIAIALAAERPPGLLGLVLCCSFACTPVRFSSHLDRLLSLVPMHRQMTSMVAPLFLGRAALPQLRKALAAVPAPVIRQRLREVLKVDYSSLAAGLQLPVIYLQASQDSVVPASACGHLRRLIPSMLVARFHTAHLLLQSAPADAAAEVLAFIRTTRPSPR